MDAIRAVDPATPVMDSLTLERKKRGFFTIMGNPLADTLKALAEAGTAAVGANFSITSADMVDLAQAALAAVSVPVVVQPNAGQPQMTAQGMRYAQDPSEFARDLAPLAGLGVASRGVAALGGCCGTDPRFISALRARLERPA